LYRYTPITASTEGIPVLIVYALVNRPYMTDLQPDRSLIRWLLEAGLDVYLIDWGYPGNAEQDLDLDAYINGYIDEMVEVLRVTADLRQVNLLGICQGGVFALCYAAMHPQKISNLVTTVTPVDFHTEHDMLSRWVAGVDVDKMVDAFGNVPGALLNWVFINLKPYQLGFQKYLDLFEIFDDAAKLKNFLRMEKWIFDSPDQAGKAFAEFVRMFYQENRLVEGGAKIGGREIDLSALKLPILNIYAEDDHLVPSESSAALAALVASDDYTELKLPGGHIGIYVGTGAQHLIPPTVAQWLRQRTHR